MDADNWTPINPPLVVVELENETPLRAHALGTETGGNRRRPMYLVADRTSGDLSVVPADKLRIPWAATGDALDPATRGQLVGAGTSGQQSDQGGQGFGR